MNKFIGSGLGFGAQRPGAPKAPIPRQQMNAALGLKKPHGVKANKRHGKHKGKP